MVKKLKLSIFLLPFLMIHKPSFAGEIGCKLSDNTIYTNKLPPVFLGLVIGTPTYQGSPFVIVPSHCTTNIRSCRVCHGSITNFLGLLFCSGGFVNGTEVDFVVSCDLDSDNLILLLLGGTSGLWFIYKPRK